jgi:hydroxypyruvate isomerase
VYELSACIETLFTERGRPFPDRARAAANAGLPAVEFWSWRDKDLAGLRRAIGETGVQVTSFVSDPPGRLVDATTHDTFLKGLADSCRLANELGAPFLVVLAGDALENVERNRQRNAVVKALRSAAPIAAEYGIVLALEPLNTRVDHPGHFLDHTPDAVSIIREVDRPSLRLLYDLYHSVVMGERPAAVLVGATDLVCHVQVADVPGRGEPGSGGVDWPAEMATLAALGYRGRIGLEYVPTGDSGASLAHIRSVVREAQRGPGDETGSPGSLRSAHRGDAGTRGSGTDPLGPAIDRDAQRKPCG